MARHPDTIRANIAAQEARRDAALWAMDGRTWANVTPPAMAYSEALDVYGKAARRLYNLRRELTRATA